MEILNRLGIYKTEISFYPDFFTAQDRSVTFGRRIVNHGWLYKGYLVYWSKEAKWDLRLYEQLGRYWYAHIGKLLIRPQTMPLPFKSYA